MRYNPETSVLDPRRDAMLIQNVRQYAEAAGLSGNPNFIWESIKEKSFVTDNEVRIFSKLNALPERSKYGMYWHGGAKSVSKKFMALTGLLVRNYINAGYITMPELSSMLMKEEHPVHRCLFIPDFFIAGSKNKTKEIPEWKKDIVYSFLLKRLSAGYLTFLYISNFKQMEESYGSEIEGFIDDNLMDMGQG